MSLEPDVQRIYEHYESYERFWVLCIATSVDTGERLVVYYPDGRRNLQRGGYEDAKICTVAHWNEKVRHEGVLVDRFRRLMCRCPPYTGTGDDYIAYDCEVCNPEAAERERKRLREQALAEQRAAS